MVHEYGYISKTGFVRNIYLSYKEILKNAGNKTDQFVSIFGYSPEDVAHSPIYGPLYFDLDNVDVQKSFFEMRQLLEVFAFYKLTKNDYQVCFSGSKGFHIAIYPQVLGVTPMVILDKVYKRLAIRFAEQIARETIDLKIYERRRLWRIVNTKNSKSDLYKIPLIGNESFAEILVKAKIPQLVQRKQPKFNPVFADWVIRAQGEIEEEAREGKPKTYTSFDNQSINPDIQQLISSGVGKGNRNHTIFYISCYLKAKGFSEEEALSYLETFARNCTPSYDDYSAIKRTMRSAYER